VTVEAIAALAGRFVAATIPHAEWTHREHLIVAVWHVHHFGADAALDRLRSGIRALNVAHGTPNSPTRGYHETMTRAYVALIAETLAADAGDLPVDRRAATVLTGPLAGKDALFRYYSRERLMSPHARAEWVEPDLTPLRIADDVPGRTRP
jgi:hypothetical protein